jgi:hypothetical protein
MSYEQVQDKLAHDLNNRFGDTNFWQIVPIPLADYPIGTILDRGTPTSMNCVFTDNLITTERGDDRIASAITSGSGFTLRLLSPTNITAVTGGLAVVYGRPIYVSYKNMTLNHVLPDSYFEAIAEGSKCERTIRDRFLRIPDTTLLVGYLKGQFQLSASRDFSIDLRTAAYGANGTLTYTNSGGWTVLETNSVPCFALVATARSIANQPKGTEYIATLTRTHPEQPHAVAPSPNDDWMDQKWEVARINIKWVFADAGAHSKYIRNLGSGKFDALLAAQAGNKGAYESISSYGPERTERFLKSIGRSNDASTPVSSQVKDTGHQVKLTFSVFGPHSYATIRWGHPDFHEHEYFTPWTVFAGKEGTKVFSVFENSTEFEIQTEGDSFTGYALRVEVDGKEAIICNFKVNGSAQFSNNGVVRTILSGGINGTGETSIRVLFNAKSNPGRIQ